MSFGHPRLGPRLDSFGCGRFAQGILSVGASRWCIEMALRDDINLRAAKGQAGLGGSGWSRFWNVDGPSRR